MPLPTQDTAHVAEGVGLLTSRYRLLQVVPGIVTALMSRVQEIETDIWSVINGVQLANHPMPGGPWDVLDKLGALVGAPPRNGRSDADYVPVIRLQIRVNRSRGLAEDIIQIAALVVAGARYYEWYPAAFEVDVFDTTSSVVAALLLYLRKSRSAGTAGTLRYSVDAGPLVTWADSTGSPVGARGFKDSVGGGFVAELTSLQPF